MSSALRRTAALAGATRYSTGKPCRRGHMADRYVSTGGCIACLRVHADPAEAYDDGAIRALDAEVRAACERRSFELERIDREHRAFLDGAKLRRAALVEEAQRVALIRAAQSRDVAAASAESYMQARTEQEAAYLATVSKKRQGCALSAYPGIKALAQGMLAARFPALPAGRHTCAGAPVGASGGVARVYLVAHAGDWPTITAMCLASFAAQGPVRPDRDMPVPAPKVEPPHVTHRPS